jgi:hypothetical protein
MDDSYSDEIDFLSSNYRVSLGCKSALPSIKIIPTFHKIQSNSTPLTTLSVKLSQSTPQMQFGVQSEPKKIRVRFDWTQNEPLLDCQIHLSSNVPFILPRSKNWIRTNPSQYICDLKQSDIIHYFHGTFDKIISIDFDTTTAKLLNWEVRVQIRPKNESKVGFRQGKPKYKVKISSLSSFAPRVVIFEIL